MLKFLASVLDQMDLALEHIQKGGVHDARFGLMLTDNAVELAIHELAKIKHAELESWRYRNEKYPYRKELDEAMGRVFEAKLKFAKLEGLVTDEQARTITLMHDFRNELYHVGLQHEAILPAISRFYFSVACEILGSYPIRGFGYSFSIQLPERSKKYFTNRGKYSPAAMEDFPNACRTMYGACDHKHKETIRALADHMEEIVAESDTCLDVLATGVYERQTRDEATIECQTWPLSFSEKGRRFARENAFQGRTMPELLVWLGAHYPLRFKEDPIPSWQKQIARLRSKPNPHTALANYVDFMNLTASLRESFYQGAAAAEEAIDSMADDYRERQRGD